MDLDSEELTAPPSSLPSPALESVILCVNVKSTTQSCSFISVSRCLSFVSTL
jgi:hypothetical protein